MFKIPFDKDYLEELLFVFPDHFEEEQKEKIRNSTDLNDLAENIKNENVKVFKTYNELYKYYEKKVEADAEELMRHGYTMNFSLKNIPEKIVLFEIEEDENLYMIENDKQIWVLFYEL